MLEAVQYGKAYLIPGTILWGNIRPGWNLEMRNMQDIQESWQGGCVKNVFSCGWI